MKDMKMQAFRAVYDMRGGVRQEKRIYADDPQSALRQANARAPEGALGFDLIAEVHVAVGTCGEAGEAFGGAAA